MPVTEAQCPEVEILYAAARDAARGLTPGSWESVGALTWLARTRAHSRR